MNMVTRLANNQGIPSFLQLCDYVRTALKEICIYNIKRKFDYLTPRTSVLLENLLVDQLVKLPALHAARTFNTIFTISLSCSILLLPTYNPPQFHVNNTFSRASSLQNDLVVLSVSERNNTEVFSFKYKLRK